MTNEEFVKHKFDRLTPIRFVEMRKGSAYWLCTCDCGKSIITRKTSCQMGVSKSCGCLRLELKTKHGHKLKSNQSLTYASWSAMRTRCNNKNYIDHHLYYDRNIKICDRWNKFENFLEDMGERQKGLTLDRIDNDKGYFKENCRWANYSQQTRNRRCSPLIEYKGERKNLIDWCEQLNLSHTAVYSRINVYKWSVEKAFERKVIPKKSISSLRIES